MAVGFTALALCPGDHALQGTLTVSGALLLVPAWGQGAAGTWKAQCPPPVPRTQRMSHPCVSAAEFEKPGIKKTSGFPQSYSGRNYYLLDS